MQWRQLLTLVVALLTFGCGQTDGGESRPAAAVEASAPATADDAPAMTTGLVGSTFACGSVASCSGASRFNEALCGTIDDPSGRTWTIPADVNASGATCVDIYNDCTGGGDNPV